MLVFETALGYVLLGVIASVIALTILTIIAFFIGKRLYRPIITRVFNRFLGLLLTEEYSENLMELWSAVGRTSVQNILEMSLRSESGKIIKRPLGSPIKFNHYDNLMFVPAQMARLPIEPTVSVDMKVTLGQNAKKPITLPFPLMIGGMGFGVALSEESKIALAKAAKQLGTAMNSGEGPFLREERNAAGLYIWQVGRYSYSRNPQAMALADMIEVQMGQGSRVGGHILEPSTIKGKAQKLMGVSPIQSLISSAVISGIKSPLDWKRYVKNLRSEVGGKPIGLKIMAGGRIESDLAVAVEAGFDYICIGGSQGGTGGSSPTITDNFGIPSINALVRAQRYLVEQGVRNEINLIVAGGYATPGECLKALALGADAIYLGTVPLFALVHRQVEKILPWEPLTQLVWYSSKYKKSLNVDLATANVVNVFKSFVLEMEEGIRAVGKTSLADLGPNDLVALDEWTADLTGVPLA